MGLDWLAADRPDGTPPERTAGMKQLKELPAEEQHALWVKWSETGREPLDFIPWATKHAEHWATDPEEAACGRVSGMFCRAIDFRGKVLNYVEWLPEDLIDQAYSNMSAAEALDYAAKLADHILPEDDPEDNNDNLRAAVEWLTYWGERGHGVLAWY
jgi:hypothetical protein